MMFSLNVIYSYPIGIVEEQDAKAFVVDANLFWDINIPPLSLKSNQFSQSWFVCCKKWSLSMNTSHFQNTRLHTRSYELSYHYYIMIETKVVSVTILFIATEHGRYKLEDVKWTIILAPFPDPRPGSRLSNGKLDEGLGTRLLQHGMSLCAKPMEGQKLYWILFGGDGIKICVVIFSDVNIYFRELQ